jgi:hypothetical protein
MKYTMTALTLLAAVSPRPASAFVASSFARSSQSRLFLFDKLFSTGIQSTKYPIYAEEAVMSKKAHGTSEAPVQQNLRWNCEFETADRSK